MTDHTDECPALDPLGEIEGLRKALAAARQESELVGESLAEALNIGYWKGEGVPRLAARLVADRNALAEGHVLLCSALGLGGPKAAGASIFPSLDTVKAEIDRLRKAEAEIERMRPVVEAARAWSNCSGNPHDYVQMLDMEVELYGEPDAALSPAAPDAVKAEVQQLRRNLWLSRDELVRRRIGRTNSPVLWSPGGSCATTRVDDTASRNPGGWEVVGMGPAPMDDSAVQVIGYGQTLGDAWRIAREWIEVQP